MNEKKQIVCILGNSVSLLVQPFRKNSSEKTYSEHLNESEFTIINSSKQSVILSDIYKYLEDECIRHFPDYVIINFGIVECTYRARPRWLQNYYSMNAWNNSVINIGYNGSINRGIKFVLKKIYKKLIEKPLFFLRIKTRWLKPNNFKFILKDISKKIFSDTPTKKIILIGMLPIKDWVEKQAPETNSSIKEYNNILQSVSSEYENIIYLDPDIITKNQNFDEITYEGIHYTAKGHQLLADKLIELLKGERVKYTEWQKINQYEGLYKIYENWNKR